MLHFSFVTTNSPIKFTINHPVKRPANRRAERPVACLPESARKELDEVEQWDWTDGVSLKDLIDWINGQIARFRPDENGKKTRVRDEFTERSFRRYQTLGCIDAPERVGKQVVYRFRQYLQGLTLRKLLWERVPSGEITLLMNNRTIAEYKEMLFEGIKFIDRPSKSSGASDTSTPSAETWKRIGVVPGVEIHLRGDLPKPKRADLKKWLSLLETALRKNL